MTSGRPDHRPNRGRRTAGDIYDRTGTVLLATTIDRDRLVAAADQLARDPAARACTGTSSVRLLKLDDAEAGRSFVSDSI
jgi:hypothetical protein